MKKFNLFIADLLFVLHFLFGAFLIFGWLFPRIKIIYLTLLIGWFLSWMILRYCMFTKWEFLLRRKYDSTINTNAEFIKYYVYKFFNKNWSSRAISIGGFILFVVFLILSLSH